MKKVWMYLAAVAYISVTAFAQGEMTAPNTTGTTTTETTTTTTTTTAATPPVTVVTYPVTTTSTTEVETTSMAVPSYPQPLAVKTARDINGKTIYLVLGTEEVYGLRQIRPSGLNWDETSLTMPSVTSPGNPLTNSRANWSITRHGNPYYPYYIVRARQVQVAGLRESYVALPNTLNAESRTDLLAVSDRYRGLTEQQAMAMGYMPKGTFTPYVGQVYVNQALVDNIFDPRVPEAFSFDKKGNLLAVHYLVVTDQPFSAFGQQFQSSPLVPGAMQLSVWLFANNPNGLFIMQSTKSYE